jgi:L-Ala-D/L-Glu epimerase
VSLRWAATPLDLRTASPFGISRWSHSEFANLVITVEDVRGVTGYGEAAPNRRYDETRELDLERLDALRPRLEGVAGDDLIEVVEGSTDVGDAGTGEVPPALRAGLSAAAWDLAGKRAGEPVWRLLGLARPSVRTSLTVAIDEPSAMVAHARQAAGFGILKVKLGFDGDLEVAERLARELSDRTFRYDANEGWDRERAARSLERLAALGAELVEQPLPAADRDSQEWLHERSAVPLYADEALLGEDRLNEVDGLYDGVVVKLQKCGGIGPAQGLLGACRRRGLRVLLGCMVESSLGVAAALQLAGLADEVDLDGPLLLAHDPFDGLGIAGDELTASAEPGLGVRAVRSAG